MYNIRRYKYIVDANNIYFTSDLHLFHKNILHLAKRPFSNINEMHEEIIRRWNEKVPENGIVYNLGDIAMNNPRGTRDVLNRLNGRIYLIRGNHEEIALDNNVIDRFENVYDYLRLEVIDGNIRQDIMLFHYPIASWDKMHRGSWNLFGHCHNSLNKDLGKSIDVGVDGNNFTPLSYYDVKSIMDTKEILLPFDHHRP